MPEALVVAAFVGWGLLPGWLLLAAACPEWSAPERAAAAPGLSLSVVACAAYGAEAVGLPVRPLPVAVVVGVLLAALWSLRWRGSGRTDESSDAGTDPTALRTRRTRRTRPYPSVPVVPAVPAVPVVPVVPVAAPAWAGWLVLLLPIAVILQLLPITTQALLPPTLHDGLDHATWFRLIYDTQSVNPHEVLAPPLASDGSPTIYPWGLHAWLALVAGTTAIDPMAVVTPGLVFISALVPLSVFVFVAGVTGRSWIAIAAAVMSLYFWWLPYQAWGWGGYALMAGAVAALPFVRLAVQAVDRLRPAAVVAVSLAAIGLLFIHPSQAMLALFVATTLSVARAVSGLSSWRVAASFAGLVVLAGVTVVVGAAAVDPIAAFVDRARDIGAALEGDPRYQWPLGLYAGVDGRPRTTAGDVLGALYVVGALAACVNRRWRPFIVLHVALGLLIPLAASRTWVTSLWYHSPERLWYAQIVSLPALAALGLWTILRVLERLTSRWRDPGRWRPLVFPMALVLFMTATHPGYADWASGRLHRFVHANETATLTALDRNLLADYAWVRQHVPPGEVLFNSAADWGLALPFSGHRTVFSSGGYGIDPSTDWNDVLALLNEGGASADAAIARIERARIRHIVVSRPRPSLSSGRDALDAAALADRPRLERVYDSATLTVFRIRPSIDQAVGQTQRPANSTTGITPSG